MNKIFRQKFLLAGMFLVAVLLSVRISWATTPVTSSADRMLALHRHDYPTPSAIALTEPQIAVTAESVEYVTIDGQSVTGYYARPENMTEPLPGILAIHEWWGLNDNIEAMTRRLAGEGYQVLAVDLYDGEVADTPEVAKQLVEQVAQNPFAAEANISKAYDYLLSERQATSVGSIGWCFGGSWSLETALLFPQELDAAVIYYGGQIGEKTAEELSTLKTPILGIFGEEDSSIPLDTVNEFTSTLEELNKEAEILTYENAGHAFANPSGQNYVPEAAEAAWSETIVFLNRYLN